LPLKDVYITSLELDQEIIKQGEDYISGRIARSENIVQDGKLVEQFERIGANLVPNLSPKETVDISRAQQIAGRMIPPGEQLSGKRRFSWIECYVDKVEDDSLDIINKFTPESKYMEESQFRQLFDTVESDYHDYKYAVGLKFTIALIEKERIRRLYFLVILARNMILTIHCTERSPTRIFEDTSQELLQKTFEDVFKKSTDVVNDARTLILARIIDDIAGINFGALRAITQKADNLEKNLKNKSEVEMYKELTRIRKYLLRFHEAMWSIYDAVYQLRHGDAKVISDQRSILNEFNNLQTRITSQIHMSENVIHLVATGFNVVQARSTSEVSIHIILLTVLGTIVLVPNTIATVFGELEFPVRMGIGQGTFTIILTVVSFGIAMALYAKRWVSLSRMRAAGYSDEDDTFEENDKEVKRKNKKGHKDFDPDK